MQGAKPGTLAEYDRIFQVLEIPYMFPNVEVAKEVLQGPYGKKLSDRLIEEAGVRVLSWMPSSFRCFTNNTRPVKTPEDMEGLKMRSMEVPLHIEMYKALGAEPTPIAWDLQTGVVTGQDNPPFLIRMVSLDEVQEYMTLDNHILNVPGFFINEDFYQSLSQEHKRIIDYAARASTSAHLGVVEASEILDLKELSKNMEIYSPTPEELERFKKAVQPPIIEMMEEEVGKEPIEELQNEVKEAKENIGW